MFTVYSADLAPKIYRSQFWIVVWIHTPGTTENRTIYPPGGVGVDPPYWVYHGLDQYGVAGRAPIYTLENSGIIRIQSTVARNYVLGDFFRIWGKTFNDKCIQLDQMYCNDPTTGMFLALYVNGKLSSEYENHVILHQDVIRIEYKQIG